MKIDRSNIEVIFLDYLDKKLGPEQIAGLMAFLADNPDLEAEFELFKNSQLSPENQIFLNKSLLKKDLNDVESITSENVEEFIIAWHENDLTDSDKNKLKRYLYLNPEFRKLFDLYSKTKIYPEKRLTYPGKKNIKKHTRVIIKPVLFRLTAAAVILILTGLFLLIQTGQKKIQPGISENYAIENKADSFEEKDQTTQNASLDNSQIGEKIFKIETPPENSEIQKKDKAETEKIEPENLSPPEDVLALLIPLHISLEYQVEEAEPVRSIKTRQISENYSQTTVNTPTARQKNFVNILQAGINGINTLTETDISFQADTDSTGRIQSLALSTQSFRLKRNLSRKRL